MTLHDGYDLDLFIAHPVSALDHLAYVITAKLGYSAVDEGQRCGVLATTASFCAQWRADPPAR